MINGINFHNLEAQKYWSFAKSYKGDPKIEAQNMIFSGEYLGSRKMDGAWYKFIKNDDGSMELLGRSKSVSGDYLDKIDWVPQLKEYFNELPNGTCLLGEIYFPNNEGSKNTTTIMGCLKEKAIARQEKGNKLHYYVFDILAFEGKDYLKMPAEQRFEELNLMWRAYPCEYVEYAKYFEGKELWNELQTILASGGEGIVITRKNSLYAPGKRTARTTLKIKKELQETIDCFFTGHISEPTKEYTGKEIETWKYWINELTGEKTEGELYKNYFNGEPIKPITKPYFYGWAGSLEVGVLKDGKVYPIGWLSGLSDEIKANHEKYKGCPLELTCMEVLYDDKGNFSGLRHAKMLQFRPDLNYKDCTWEKFVGENK